MYSMDKYGKLKRQINRYFLPLEINPQLIIDALKNQQKKTNSPTKIRQQTLNKLSQQTKKIDLLKVTGKQMNNNVAFSIKTPQTRISTGKSPQKKQIYRRQIQLILQQPFEQFLEKVNAEQNTQVYSKELSELERLHKTLVSSSSQSKDFRKEQIDIQNETKIKMEQLIMKNPQFYKKLVSIYQKCKLENEKAQRLQRMQEREKKYENKEGITKRRMTSTIKRVNYDKQMSPAQLKKYVNFIQYRQFLLTVNMSNGLVMLPEDENQYKAFICKGNNGLLVKSIVKSRPWWCIRSLSDVDSCTMIWSEWKKIKLTNSLPSGGGKKMENNGEKNLTLQVSPEKSSFYVSNYYQRINSNTFNQEKEEESESEKNQQRSTSISSNKNSGTKFFFNRIKHNNTEIAMITGKTNIRGSTTDMTILMTNKTDSIPSKKTINIAKSYQIKKLIKIDKFMKEEYLNLKDNNNSTYFQFSKKINQKKFAQNIQKYLPNLAIYNRPKASMKILNHLPGCYQLHSKKLLYLNLKKYYEKTGKNVFDYTPQTYLITDGLDDPNFSDFQQKYKQNQAQYAEAVKNGEKKTVKNIWICKPGENSNRGNGITVLKELNDIKNLLKARNTGSRSVIIQKYMQNPYLYHKRKFDIRTYILFTTVNGALKCYWYQEGYLRTTSKEYSLKNIQNKFIHLTNDAIQKKGEEYGKFENCNKVSYSDFQKYIEAYEPHDIGKFAKSVEKMKQIAFDLVISSARKLNPKKKQFCFQLFGLDYMLDSNLQPFLIQANSNPCLESQGSVLSKIIPHLIQNTIRIAIDPLCPPPYSQNWKTTKFSPANPFQHNKFTLIYDSMEESGEQDQVDEKQVVQEENECEQNDQEYE